MLKRKMVCAAVTAMVASVTVSASAAVNTMYNTFNEADSLDSGWNNPNGVSMVKTDIMPSGYSIKGNADNRVWISSKTVNTFSESNRYYMSYYINTSDFIDLTTANLFHVGIYNGNTALFRTGINAKTGFATVDKGQLNASASVNKEMQDGKTYQVVSRIWKGTNMAGAVYVYDVESGDYLGVSSTISGDNFNSIPGERTIKIGNNTASGTQYISDFKLIEADSTDYGNVTNLVNTDMTAVDFSDIKSQLTGNSGSYEIAADVNKITFPEVTTTAKGSMVTYSCNDSSVIDAEGNVKHGITDKRVFIIATLENSGAAMERALAVTVKGTGSAAVASEDWSGAGETISGYIPSDNGFSGAWKTDLELTTDSEASLKTLGDKKLVYLEGKNVDETGSIENNLYNKLNTPVDMDTDAAYYLSYVFDFESEKMSGSVQRFAKFGLMSDDASDEISSVFMMRYAGEMPYIGIKSSTAGSSVNWLDGETINPGSIYNVMMKISASADSNDTVAFKVWPVGTNEPLAWTYEKTAAMTGTYSKVFLQSRTEVDNGAYFGDFKLEAYTAEDLVAVSGAETALKEYVQSTDAAAEPVAIEWPIANSVAEKSYNNIKQLRNNAYVSEVIINSADTRIAGMDEVESDISVTVNVSNDAGIINEFNQTIFVAAYDEAGTLKAVDLAEVNEVGAGTFVSEAVELENVAGTTVRVFIWNDNLTPYMNKTTVSDCVKNY